SPTTSTTSTPTATPTACPTPRPTSATIPACSICRRATSPGPTSCCRGPAAARRGRCVRTGSSTVGTPDAPISTRTWSGSAPSTCRPPSRRPRSPPDPPRDRSGLWLTDRAPEDPPLAGGRSELGLAHERAAPPARAAAATVDPVVSSGAQVAGERALEPVTVQADQPHPAVDGPLHLDLAHRGVRVQPGQEQHLVDVLV